LTSTDDVSEPYPNPCPEVLGTAETLRAWIVPLELMQEGPNGIEIVLAEGAAPTITFLDLATPSEEENEDRP
jgi:hypothetical protein